jgi:hypothetical protein
MATAISRNIALLPLVAPAVKSTHLARLTHTHQSKRGDAITIVRPETVVRWHRKGFAAYWRWKARSRGGRPRIAKEVRDGPVLSSAEAGVNLELLIVYGVACFAPSAHGVKDDFY